MNLKLGIALVLAICLLAIGVSADCTPAWTCDLYGYCNASNVERCIQANDTNNCNVTYSGNYSEFGHPGCDYCTPDFYCSRGSGYCNNIIHKKDCMEVTDRNNCFTQTNLSEDNFDGNFSAYIMSCGYIAQYNTTDIKNEAVDAMSGAAVEFMNWVRVFMVLVAIGVFVFGGGAVIIEKVKSWTHR